MKRAAFIVVAICIVSQVRLFSQTQEEVAKQIQAYVQQMESFIRPAKAAFEELNQHYANRRTGSMDDAEKKIETVSREAYANLEAVKPLFGETQLKEATGEILRVLINGTQDEFPKITNRYKVAYPTQADNDAVIEYSNRFNAKWEAAGKDFETAKEALYVNHWAPIGNKEICPAIDAILRDAPNKFENLKGKEDEMVPMAWDCKTPFPGAQHCRCMFLMNPSVRIKFFESPEFQQVASAQHALYLYVKSCSGGRFTFSDSKLKTQAQVDDDEISSYTFSQPGIFEGRISVDKTFLNYTLNVVFEVNR